MNIRKVLMKINKKLTKKLKSGMSRIKSSTELIKNLMANQSRINNIYIKTKMKFYNVKLNIKFHYNEKSTKGSHYIY